jgi:membrane protease YdiL (CAAX protease family)
MPAERDSAATPSLATPSRTAATLALLRRGHEPLTALYLTLPVFAVYHVGLPLSRFRNGSDFVTRFMLEVLRLGTFAYVAVTLAFAAVIACVIVVLRRRYHAHMRQWGPMLLESAALAVVLPLASAWTTARLLAWSTGRPALGVFDGIVQSAGAGFYEELMFRVLLFGGLAYVLRRFTRMSASVAAVVAALASALVFSAVHYVGSYGDAFEIASSIFRFVGGVLLAAVYRLRGFAVAVYTHAFYDVLVLVVL